MDARAQEAFAQTKAQNAALKSKNDAILAQYKNTVSGGSTVNSLKLPSKESAPSSAFSIGTGDMPKVSVGSVAVDSIPTSGTISLAGKDLLDKDDKLTSTSDATDVAGQATTATKEGGASDSIQPSNMDAAGNASASELNTKYSAKNARLVNFSYLTGADDEERRAYFKIQGNIDSLKTEVAGENTSILQGVYYALTSKYTAFSLLRIDESLQEKQSVMPTVGDSFAVTFSGKEPQIINLAGYLPFDAEKGGSWYTSFVNAYKFLMRASVLAKHKCSLKIVLPDYVEYVCYPISFQAALSSESDHLIQFNMACIVINFPVNKAYGYNADTTKSKSTVEDVKNSESKGEDAKTNVDGTKTSTAGQDASNETTSGKTDTSNTKDPKEVGEKTKKKNFVESFTSGVKKAMNSPAMKTLNKGMAVLKEAKGTVNVLTGKPYGGRASSRTKRGGIF